MTDCPFCSNHVTSSIRVIAKNEYCYVLENIEGHLQGLLVIPFRHVETPFELTTEEWSALQPLVKSAQEILAQRGADGFNLGWNVGEVGGQEVSHVHLHVIARFADEPFAGAGIRRWFKSAKNRRPTIDQM